MNKEELAQLEEMANHREDRLERGYNDYVNDLADAVIPLLDHIKELQEQKAVAKETLLAVRSYTMGLIRSKINEALNKIEPEVNWFIQDQKEGYK